MNKQVSGMHLGGDFRAEACNSLKSQCSCLAHGLFRELMKACHTAESVSFLTPNYGSEIVDEISCHYDSFLMASAIFSAIM
jgi:hypothetical protein